MELTAIDAITSLTTVFQGIDETLLVWMNTQRHPWLDSFFDAVTWAGSLYVLLPLSMAVLALVLLRKRRHDAELLVLGFGGAVMITHWVKWLVGRPRPTLFPPLTPLPADFSFPSGHTAQITALAYCLTIIACGYHKTCASNIMKALAVLIAVLVGASRVYLQVHYLSDVVAGALLSLLWVRGVHWALARLSPRSSP